MNESKCEAEWNSHDDSEQIGWLLCLLEGEHSGDHETYVAIPCPTCGGLDAHFEECPDVDLVTDDLLILRFDNDGWIWVDHRLGERGHFSYNEWQAKRGEIEEWKHDG